MLMTIPVYGAAYSACALKLYPVNLFPEQMARSNEIKTIRAFNMFSFCVKMHRWLFSQKFLCHQVLSVCHSENENAFLQISDRDTESL